MVINERFQQGSGWSLSRRRAAATVLGLPLALRCDPGLASPSAKPGVSWLADVQRVPTKLPANAPRLPGLLVDSQGKAIETQAAWTRRRAQLRRAWQTFLGPPPLFWGGPGAPF